MLTVLLLPFAAAAAQAGIEDSFYAGDLENYPKPIPVLSVQRQAGPVRDALAAAFRAFPEAVKGVANSHVRVRIRALKVMEQSGGERLLAVGTEWENIHPKVGVSRGAAEGKVDRTMGAGRLLGGGSRSDADDQVWRDVAYKVPKWSQHLVLLADGVACPLDPRSPTLADGADPGDSFTLARQGETRTLRFAFRVPAQAENLALHLFDYNNGHISIPLAGDAGRALRPAAMPGAQRGSGLEIAVPERQDREQLNGRPAPEGWRFLALGLLGKSLARSGAAGAIARIKPDALWLQDADGFLYPALAAGDGPLDFFPDYPTRAQAAFLLPADAEPAGLVLRAGNETLMPAVPGGKAVSLPAPLQSRADGEHATWSLLGVARRDDRLVLDLAVRNRVPDRGLELAPLRQFELAAGDERLKPDRQATAALAHGAPDRLVVPPGTTVRFLVAFSDRQGKLAYRGLAGETEPIALDATAARAPAERLLVTRPQVPAGMAVAHGPAPAEPTAPPEGRAERPPAPPVAAWAPLDLEGITVEQEAEPNDEAGTATLVRGDRERVIRGRIQRKDADHYVLQTDGEPQLWDVTAYGEAVERIDFSGGPINADSRVSAVTDRKTHVASLRNLYLLPGRHHFKLVSRLPEDKPGEYHLRFTPKGAPDPGAEREPNDNDRTAQPIPTGRWISGIADGEWDLFRFRLERTARVRLELQAGPDADDLRVNLEPDPEDHFWKAGLEAGQTHRAEAVLPHGEYRLSVGRDGGYRFRIDVLPPSAGEAAAIEGLELTLPDEAPAWAAFIDQAQSASLPVTLTNRGPADLDLKLTAWPDHWGWRAVMEPAEVRVPAGGERRVEMNITAPPDLPGGTAPVLWVQATDASGRAAFARQPMPVACDAAPLEPARRPPVPEPLLGGLDLAWQALGGRLIDPAQRKTAALIDGMTPNSGTARLRIEKPDQPVEVTVALGGEAPVAGFLLHPLGCDREEMARDFEILLSRDGKAFTPVLEGRLEARPREQAFVLERPVPARQARLRLRSTHGSRDWVCLGEWKVVARPGHGGAAQGFNLADPALGGHLVWARPMFRGHDMLSGKARSAHVKPDQTGSIQWVVGFHHDRAARIRRLEWQDWEGNRKWYRLPAQVRVSASTTGPLGPWREIATWRLAPDAGTLELEQPVWARFLRFSLEGLDPKQGYRLPGALRIHEVPPAPDGYRSILGEWGHYRPLSLYEWRRPADGPADATPRQGSRQQPLPLAPGVLTAGRVRHGSDEDWYRIRVEGGPQQLSLQVESDELFKLGVELLDAEGRPLAWLSEKAIGGTGSYQARLAPGDYLLHVAEQPRSVAIVWDQSGSVQSFIPGIYRALSRFTQGITPGAEYANFLPFQDSPRFLLEHWSDQPWHLLRALNDYRAGDRSSRAETNLIAASRALGKRRGGRVVIFITDAASEEEITQNEALWQALAAARPRIFTVELHDGHPKSLPGQQDRMQDWAAANGGHYSFFRDQADLDTALERAICKARRPAAYRLRTALAEIEPGTLRLARGRLSAAGAIELILDASGSMYKRLPDGNTRIGVARAVLRRLVKEVVPEGTPVALRVYGHREKRSCRTDLEIPLGPLEPQRLLAAIDRIDPKPYSKTPLAESIRRVAQDLKQAEGRRLVVLLTDGEESCNGDPGAAIRALRSQGIDVQLNIVGFTIDDDALQRTFAGWAEAGGGRYFDADNEDELFAALRDAFSPAFEVIGAHGRRVASGVVGGDPVSVEPGSYRVRIFSAPPVTLENVTVEPGAEVVLEATSGE